MKTFGVAIMMILVAASLAAQPREEKNFELSLSGSYQYFSFGEGSDGSGAFLISPRLGVFIVEGLEFEPEVLLMFASERDPVYVLNGLLSYNFLSVGKAVPFLLAGYGVANTVPFFNVPLTSYDFSVGVVNAGAGVKVFLSEDIALRIEYRFQRFTGEGEYTSNYGFGSFSWTQKVDTRIHSAQFGISILL